MEYEDNQYYHIYNRGAGKGPIFFGDRNYRYCINLFEKYRGRYKTSITAYCLMPNHYHFILRQIEGGSISRFLQTIFNGYTQAINKELKRSGTLFEGRAKGILIDSDRYLFQVIRYIHLNPVAAKLVEKGEDWEFSDYCEWISHRVSRLTDLELRNENFKNGDEYRQSVEEFQLEKMKDEIQKYLLD